MWIGRASINQAEPEGFRGGRDRGKRVVKDREEREREMMVLVVMVVLLGAWRKRESVGGGEERRGEERCDCKSGGVRGGRWGERVWVGRWVSEGGVRRGEEEVTEGVGVRVGSDGGG